MFFVLLVKEVFISLLAGYYFPLSILPNIWNKLLNILPFKYFSSYPVTIILNNNSITSWCKNTTIELAWIIILYLISFGVTKRGLKKYADTMG